MKNKIRTFRLRSNRSLSVVEHVEGNNNRISKIVSFFTLLTFVSLNLSCFGGLRAKDHINTPLIGSVLSLKISEEIYEKWQSSSVWLHLSTEEPEKEEGVIYFDNEVSWYGDFEDDELETDLPAGLYYGRLEFSATQRYPFLFSVRSSMRIYFGYYIDEEYEVEEFNGTFCVPLDELIDYANNRGSDNINYDIVCPRLNANYSKSVQVYFDYDDEEPYYDGNATGLNIITGLILAGIPWAFVGVVVNKQDIDASVEIEK
ncbi:MAG: hypothetical protein H7A23_12275 [Leptospiraceae bacterium]|nr:hypothetical protein [Leptospiraceae bacterium]MCP5495324.1 hypothetical protein [Leptospiraceae bacterium]